MNRISSFSGDQERYRESAGLPEIPDIDSMGDEVIVCCILLFSCRDWKTVQAVKRCHMDLESEKIVGVYWWIRWSYYHGIWSQGIAWCITVLWSMGLQAFPQKVAVVEDMQHAGLEKLFILIHVQVTMLLPWCSNLVPSLYYCAYQWRV